MRRAQDIALPAVVASRIMARPKVQQLGDELHKAGLLLDGQLLQEHDAATERAVALFTATLDDAEACQVAPLVRQAAENAAIDWQRRSIEQTAAARLPRVHWTGLAPMDTMPPSGGSKLPIGAQADDPFHDQPQDDGLADGLG